MRPNLVLKFQTVLEDSVNALIVQIKLTASIIIVHQIKLVKKMHFNTGECLKK